MGKGGSKQRNYKRRLPHPKSKRSARGAIAEDRRFVKLNRRIERALRKGGLNGNNKN